MIGAAQLLLDLSQSPESLIAAVYSPNGTTVAGLEQFQRTTISQYLQSVIQSRIDKEQLLSVAQLHETGITLDGTSDLEQQIKTFLVDLYLVATDTTKNTLDNLDAIEKWLEKNYRNPQVMFDHYTRSRSGNLCCCCYISNSGCKYMLLI